MNAEDIVRLGAPGLQAVSIAITAYFASRGLNAWRQQLAGKRRFELAEEILVVTYKVQRSLAHVRQPLTFGGEGKLRPRDDHERESMAALKDNYFVPLERMKGLDDELAQFSKTRLFAQAHLGREAVAPFDIIMKAYHEVAVAARMLIMTAEERPRDVGLELHQSLQATVWQTSVDDEIARRVDDAVRAIEDLVRPWLEEPGRRRGSGLWQRARKSPS